MVKEFTNIDLNYDYKFSRDCYVLKVYDNNSELIAEKSKDSELLVHGAVSLVSELVHNMISIHFIKNPR